MLKKQIAWIKRILAGTIEWLKPKAKDSIKIVNYIKMFVESDTAGVLVSFIPSQIDDIILSKMREFLPKIVVKLQVSDMILDAGNPDDVIKSLIEYLKKQNKDVRAMFYVQLAAKLTEAFADGQIDNMEALAISQMIYKEIKAK